MSVLCGAPVGSAASGDEPRGDEASYFRSHAGLAVGDTSLPDAFQSDQRRWRRELPPGNSSPCVCGDSIYLTFFDKDRQQLGLVALDRVTGKERWRRLAPTDRIEPYHPVGSPASSTPACDGSRVFAFFGSYGLLCYDLDGNLVWSRKMGPFQDEFGASSSPVLVDGKVILNEDHDIDSFLIALDAETGKTAWKTARDGFTRSYSTPVVWPVAGGPRIVVAGSLQLAAYDPATGKKQWWINGLSRIVDTTPVIVGGTLYAATWTPGGDPASRIAMGPYAKALELYDRNDDQKLAKTELPAGGAVFQRFFRIDLDQDGKLDNAEWKNHARVFERAQNVAMAVRPGGKGDVSKTHVRWTQRRGLPTVPSPVVYRGVMYMVKDGGILTSLDVETGEIRKRGRLRGPGNYYASLVAGDGKVFAVSERGVVTVLTAGAEWEILGSHDLKERVMATPVPRHGRIYLRTDTAVYCFAAPSADR